MSAWERMLAFLARHKKALVISLVVYVLAVALLVALSQGPQTEPFLYQVD